MTPRFTIAAPPVLINQKHWELLAAQIKATLMQAAAELELLPAKHYAKWGKPQGSALCAAAVSDLMRQIEQLAAEWRVIANES